MFNCRSRFRQSIREVKPLFIEKVSSLKIVIIIIIIIIIIINIVPVDI